MVTNHRRYRMTLSNSYEYGVHYSTRTFSEIFPTVNDFNVFRQSCPISPPLSDDTYNKLYYLLYAEFGNSHIASSDENRMKYSMMRIIYSYGPAWETRLELQRKIMELTDEELQYGAQAIYNSAFNPDTQTGADADGKPKILDYVSQQNVTSYKKNKLDAYALKMEIIRSDVTTPFLSHFRKLFTKWGSELPLYFKTEV